MGDEVQITVNKEVFLRMDKQLMKMINPAATYNTNTETFLKTIIAEQKDRAVHMANIITEILDGQYS